MDGSAQFVRVSVGQGPIDPSALLDQVGHDASGATVLFLGTVRDHSRDKEGVTHLQYEVYPEMVEEKIREIVDEAIGRWPVLGAVVVHRSGEVRLREASVAVCVSTAHRGDAFEAARYIMDELKQRAPIWKKEFWPGGAKWSEGS